MFTQHASHRIQQSINQIVLQMISITFPLNVSNHLDLRHGTVSNMAANCPALQFSLPGRGDSRINCCPFKTITHYIMKSDVSFRPAEASPDLPARSEDHDRHLTLAHSTTCRSPVSYASKKQREKKTAASSTDSSEQMACR